MFVWLRVPGPYRFNDFAATTQARDASTMPAAAVAVDRSTTWHGVRIKRADASSREQLAHGLADTRAHAARPATGAIRDDPGLGAAWGAWRFTTRDGPPAR
ncbi:hypothetical protein PWR63_24405 [Paraburkholderia sp. A2WS-5]|uniref:hypothetical protein n=1 Tax=unclassified Paraburkholderia TaxID=2615204 RepID=UPI003B7A2A60